MKKQAIILLFIVFFPANSVFAQSVPYGVEQRIKQIYAEKYPNNFSMQKTLIEDQFASYRNLQGWTTEVG